MEAIILLAFSVYVAVFALVAYGVAVLVMSVAKRIRRKKRDDEYAEKL